MGKQDNHLWGIAEVGIHQIKRNFVIADDGIAGRVCVVDKPCGFAADRDDTVLELSFLTFIIIPLALHISS